MHDSGLSLRVKAEPTFLEYFQHRDIVRQDLGDQFLEPGCAGNLGEMTHECRAYAFPLVLVHAGESDRGLPGLYNDITSAAHADEVNIHKERNFRLRQGAFYGKETAINGLLAGAAEGCKEASLVVRSESADFDAASIVQRLNR